MTVVKLHFIHRRQADLWHRLKWIKLVHRNMQEIKKKIMNKILHTCKSRLNKSPIQLKARALSFCVSVNPLVWSTSDCNIEWLYLVARRYLFGCERIRWANQNADISFIQKRCCLCHAWSQFPWPLIFPRYQVEICVSRRSGDRVRFIHFF